MNPADPSAARSAWQVALQILARRAHSRAELAAKLTRRGFGQPQIDAVLDRCLQLGYLNDADWAQIQIGQLIAKGYGSHYIRHSLRGKGIEANLVEAAIAGTGGNWEAEAAGKALDKKQASLARQNDPAKRRAKAYRFLVQRGFSAEAIAQAMNLTAGMRDESF